MICNSFPAEKPQARRKRQVMQARRQNRVDRQTPDRHGVHFGWG